MKKNIKSIAFIVFLLFVIIITVINSKKYFSNKTFARYFAGASALANVEIAVPIINDTVEIIRVPLDEMVPGLTKEYDFAVMNYDTETSTATETSLNYTLTIQGSEYIPLTYEVQKDGVTSNILTNGVSPTYTLEHTTPTIHNYKLIINWPATSTNYTYANLVEVVTITINAEQKVN